MEINKLVDLDNLRSAPQLSNRQEKKLLEELEAYIFNANWITIGIMAPTDKKAFLSVGAIMPIVIQLALKIYASSSSKSFFSCLLLN